MTNQQIATLLRNVAAAYTVKNEKKYRFQIIAYQRAADAIENTTTQIKDLYKEGQLEDLPGVGTSIRNHLEEYFATGKVKHFDWVMDGIPKAMFPLLEVPSFGPKKAYRLVTHFHLKDPETVLADLANLAIAGKISSLEGFGEKSQEDIIRALAEYKEGKGKTTRMVLPYAFDLAEKIRDYLKQCPDVIDVQPLGSLRRMKSTIGDIDFAVATEKPAAVIDYFLSYPYKERIIEKGDISASFLTSGGKQIDLMTMPADSFGSLLQHFTGSKHHNVHLREYALKKGLSLSEYGIKKVKRDEPRQKFTSEKAFYTALGLQWVPPEMREDTGEIEHASQHTLPRLVELSDIKGDLHIHSSFPIEPSHDLGITSIEEMAQFAIELGYEYLGFSEHNPSVSKHTVQQMYELIAKRNNVLDGFNKKQDKLKLFKFMETDILANGKLALDEKSLSILDGSIVSIHSVFSMNKKDMTKRIIEGLSHPKARILAHPTGRLLNTRNGYDIDWDVLFDFCKKQNIALEINSWPARLDLPDIMVREAVNNGIKMVIDTDSHAVDQMTLMRYGVSVARRGWAEKKDIVNTLSVKEFESWLINKDI